MSAPKPHWTTRVAILAPYLWLVAFFLVPFAIVVKISLSQSVLAQPPYTPAFDFSEGWQGVKDFFAALSFSNYANVLTDSIYAWSYGRSFQVAVLSTAMLLVLGYPVAYAMARAPRRWQPTLVMLVVLPFWTSFLIRVYAWMTILQHDGLLNRVLGAFGIVNEPIIWLPTSTAVYIGVVYSYFPFMVLPLYAALEKMDGTLLEAAADLGCPPWRAFLSITIPLSLPGIVAGSLLCFIPIMGEFVIPDLLGPSDTLMVGQMLWTDFFRRDWPAASALAVLLLLLLLPPIIIYRQREAKALERGR